jgi:predicted ATPase
VLVDSLLAGSELPPEARLRVLEAAEGNPLFLEQMAAMLAENGTDTSELIVPATIHALLGARLDQLEPEERTVIEQASVIGKVFYWGAVTHLCPEGMRSRAGSHLLTLARKDLIGPEHSDIAAEDAFRFRHILIRDAAYQALPKRARSELHEGFADWLEAKAPEQDEILGYHLEQACRRRRVCSSGRSPCCRATIRLGSSSYRMSASPCTTWVSSRWRCRCSKRRSSPPGPRATAESNGDRS